MPSLRFFWLGACLLLCLAHAQAQPLTPKLPLNQRVWADGFYESYEDFQKNRPAKKPQGLQADLEIHLQDSSNVLYLYPPTAGQQLWGVCFNGQPYVRVTIDSALRESAFVRLHVLGQLSYFYYPVWEDKTVMMDVYNPYTGKKIASKPVINKEKQLAERFFHWTNGQILPFNEATLQQAIAQDPLVLRTLTDLSPSERTEKLFRILLIFNDRHPVYP